MPSFRTHMIDGARTTLPLLPGIAPFGFIAGIAAVDAGLPASVAVAMSALIFAGASQLAAISLMAAGAAPLVVLATILVINLRFAMYSASLAPHFGHLGALKKMLAGYLLVDQCYALSIVRYGTLPPEAKFPFYLGVGAAIWPAWVGSTLAGALLGASVPDAWSLEFTMPLVFLSMLVASVRDWPMLVAALTGGVVTTLAHGMPLKLGIITGALSGITAGVVAGALRRRRPGST